MTIEELLTANTNLRTMNIKGKDYVPVNERIKAFRLNFPEGVIKTELQRYEDGICIFKATVENKGVVIATGHACEKESERGINQTSCLENCETSAVGRALGIAGIGIEISVASAEEVRDAQNNQKGLEQKYVNTLLKVLKDHGYKPEEVCNYYKVKMLNDLNYSQFKALMDSMGE